jgi:hypothetical protein
MSFGLYAIGLAVMIGGLTYGAHLVHMPTHWIVVGAIILSGVGIFVWRKGDATERSRGIAVSSIPLFGSAETDMCDPGRPIHEIADR